MVTIYDIAKECGVSVATVSKSLNNLSGVSLKTKERIQRMSEEMGYLPNSQARTLVTKKSNNIGVLFADDTKIGLSYRYFSKILEYLRYEVESRGYDLCFVSVHSPYFKDDYYKHCCYKGIDGVVIVTIDFNAKNVLELIHSEIPVVLIDKEIMGKTSVVSDNYNGIRDAVRYLVQCGHEKIGFIHGEEVSNDVTEKRLAGFYKGMKENGISINEDWIKPAVYYRRKDTYERAKQILSLKERPTALLLPDDYVAFGAYQAAKELGLKIPEDISFVGCDGLDLGETMFPTLTTISQNSSEIGRVAGEQITRLIDASRPVENVKSISAKLEIRDSVKKNVQYEQKN